MTANQSKSPDDHKFKPRKPSFNFAGLSGEWQGGSAFATAFENSFSMLFPQGEKVFISSVKAFEDKIDDPKLLNEIKAFYAQEAIHTQQHIKYNKLVCKLRGYDLEKIEEPLRKRIAWAQSALSASRILAGTAASEHLTAILADDMLRHKDHFVDADPDIAKLWYWHAIEEMEHKAVAFDVHLAIGGTIKERRQALLFNTFHIFKDVFRILCMMLKHDGKLWSIREWWSGFIFLFIKPGVLRRTIIPWLRFFKKDFHPWDKDNRHLITEWENS
jgi:hypothetical protein